MLKTIGFMLIVAILVGAWGYHRGWFSVSGTNADGKENVTFGLDTDKLKQDLQGAQSSVDEKWSNFEAQLAKLKERAKAASGDMKDALERQVQEFEKDGDQIASKLKELKKATGDKIKQLAGEIQAALDKALAAIGKALESIK